MSIEDLHHGVGHVVTIQVLAAACYERRNVDWQRYRILQLDNASGSVKAMVWPDAAKAIGKMPTMSCNADVQGWARWFNGELIKDVQSLRRIPAKEIQLGATLLPRHLCSAAVLTALWNPVESSNPSRTLSELNVMIERLRLRLANRLRPKGNQLMNSQFQHRYARCNVGSRVELHKCHNTRVAENRAGDTVRETPQSTAMSQFGALSDSASQVLKGAANDR